MDIRKFVQRIARIRIRIAIEQLRKLDGAFAPSRAEDILWRLKAIAILAIGVALAWTTNFCTDLAANDCGTPYAVACVLHRPAVCVSLLLSGAMVCIGMAIQEFRWSRTRYVFRAGQMQAIAHDGREKWVASLDGISECWYTRTRFGTYLLLRWPHRRRLIKVMTSLRDALIGAECQGPQ